MKLGSLKSCIVYVWASWTPTQQGRLRSVIGWSPPYLEFNAQHEVKIILELVAAHMWEGSSYIALKMGVFNKSRASKQAAAAMNLQSVQNSWGFFSSNWNTLRFLNKSTKIQDSYFSVENLNFPFYDGLQLIKIRPNWISWFYLTHLFYFFIFFFFLWKK